MFVSSQLDNNHSTSKASNMVGDGRENVDNLNQSNEINNRLPLKRGIFNNDSEEDDDS